MNLSAISNIINFVALLYLVYWIYFRKNSKHLQSKTALNSFNSSIIKTK